MLIFFRISALRSGVSVIFTPSASRTSAAPDLEDAALFPCFATGTPPAAITREVTYGLVLGSCIFCTVLTLAVYALLRAAAEADHGSEEMYQRMQHKEGRR